LRVGAAPLGYVAMVHAEGEAELLALISRDAPALACSVAFGIPAPRGVRGWSRLGAQIVEALVSGAGGLSPADLTASGVALSAFTEGILIAPAERRAEPLGRACWMLRGPAVRLAWSEARSLVRVERPNAEQLFLTLPVGGEEQRHLFWNGIAGLPRNLEAARALVAKFDDARVS